MCISESEKELAQQLPEPSALVRERSALVCSRRAAAVCGSDGDDRMAVEGAKRANEMEERTRTSNCSNSHTPAYLITITTHIVCAVRFNMINICLEVRARPGTVALFVRSPFELFEEKCARCRRRMRSVAGLEFSLISACCVRALLFLSRSSLPSTVSCALSYRSPLEIFSRLSIRFPVSSEVRFFCFFRVATLFFTLFFFMPKHSFSIRSHSALILVLVCTAFG